MGRVNAGDFIYIDSLHDLLTVYGDIWSLRYQGHFPPEWSVRTNGEISEFRVSKGDARWENNFMSPSCKDEVLEKLFRWEG